MKLNLFLKESHTKTHIQRKCRFYTNKKYLNSSKSILIASANIISLTHLELHNNQYLKKLLLIKQTILFRDLFNIYPGTGGYNLKGLS